MNVIPFRPANRNISAVDEDMTTCSTTTPDDSSTPVKYSSDCCPECGNPVLTLEDRICCSRAEEAGCKFSITINELESALYGSLSPFIAEIVIDCTGGSKEILHWMWSSSDKKFSTEFESLMECNVGIDLWIVKVYDGLWTIGIAYKQYFADDEGK